MIGKWKPPAVIYAMVLHLVACSGNTEEQPGPLADVPPPSEWRLISANDATSNCIGDPKTPLCAMETLMACFARHEISLCNKVNVFDMHFPGEPYVSRYRILRTEILTKENIEEKGKGADWQKLGDVDFTVYEPDGEDDDCKMKHCNFDWQDGPDREDECCNWSYAVRRLEGKWQVINWWWWADH